MTPAQWARVTALFGEARELPPDARVAFVETSCPDDDVVRAEVLALLSDDREDDFLERGAVIQPVDLLDAAGGHAFAPGDAIGHYRVERLLARGGMGVVYIAVDTRLGRRVTLKVLPAALTRDAQARERLQREARIAAGLRHPHIVSVHALEEVDDLLVIVAEYVEGPSLAEVIAAQGPLSRERWHAAACDLAEALAAAHAAHVVHRDVKTGNVVLGEDGIRLVDFGIALADADASARLTLVGQAGTPLAQAPEQLDGGDATPLSDQFSYGVLLYEAASARVPFGDGPIASVWARMLRDAPAPLRAPQLTAAQIALVHRCLSRQPEDRFPSMHAIADALDAALRDESTPVVESERASWSSRWLGVHHAATAALYIAMLWPGWLVAAAVPRPWRAWAHIALICLAAVATSVRLHLWFSARQYPRHIADARVRLWPLLTGVDVLYALLVAGMALAAADLTLVPSVCAAGLSVCLAVASLVIEPATRRAAMSE
ncbi:MAG: serine/threonine protein kinase [Acidobacteria bacterium]|nr:serine/threonine protein kinase [Acidobacteriota bacterium]